MKATSLLVVLSLSLAACATNPRTYTDYARPDSSVVYGGLPSSPGIKTYINRVPVNLAKIDGMDIASTLDPAGDPARKIEISPGHHRLVVDVSFPPEKFRTLVDLETAGNQVFRLSGVVKPYGYWVQLWEETAGADKRRLLGEIEVSSVAPDLPGVLQMNLQRAQR